MINYFKCIVLVALVSVGSLANGMSKGAAAPVDLLALLEQNVETRPIDELKTQLPKYARLQQFGAWIDADSPRDCQNTRAEVLISSADPSESLTFTNEKNCTVATGLWHDPYTGTDVREAKQLQVDHVVPLHEAYLMGAHEWNFKKRCSYANYIGNEFHLMAVFGRENLSKGDRGPDRYMPPNTQYQCTYLHNWMRIKAIWDLKVKPSEVTAIHDLIQSLGCAVSETTISEGELDAEKRKASVLIEACPDEPPPPPPRATPTVSSDSTQTPHLP